MAKATRKYQVVDRHGEPVAEPFASEREAYDAMRVYRDNCADIDLPMKVVPLSREAQMAQAGITEADIADTRFPTSFQDSER